MTAVAAGVSAEWLALREPADAAARSEELAERLARHLPAGPLVIHDLGGGSGAMGRWLAPRLPGPQRWVVHDRDPDLLALAAATCETRRSDITRLSPGDLAGADAVVASALLDLLTRDELHRMLAACSGLPMLLALTVVGRVRLTPAEPLDAHIGAAFDDHQRRDGRLGPDAVAAAADALGGNPTAAVAATPGCGPDVAAALGGELRVRSSPWRLGPAEAGLLAEWLRGWVAAACEQDPGLTVEADAYLARRLAQAVAGELAVTVDHADLLVLP